MVSWQKPNKINFEPEVRSLSSLVNRQRAWVEIDLTALADNVRALKTFLAPQTELMAVVKADAYGHGAIAVAKTALANGADCLAIATLAEGVELRAEINAPIVILGAINAVEDIKAVAAWELEPTICHEEQALAFEAALASVGKTLCVHLKLDTGMSRLGTNWQDAVPFVRLVHSLPHLEIKSIYSHFATADERDRTIMNLQHQRFEDAIASVKAVTGFMPPQVHLANSAATLSDRAYHYDLVRVGLALYGLYPAEHLNQAIDLKPVLQLKAKVTQVKTIPTGEGVSYGRKFIAQKDTKVAVVGIGYADGVPRNLSNRLQAIVCGKLVSQIGSITMDQLMLEVDAIPDLQPGEVVTLIGEQNNLKITADEWANKLDTISWEILCGFKHRLPRIFN